MGAIDEFLPKAILDATQIILNMIGAILVTSIINPLFLIPISVMFLIFIFIRKIYLKTSKNIKRLEGVGKLSFVNMNYYINVRLKNNSCRFCCCFF